jgi:hypothetical protein
MDSHFRMRTKRKSLLGNKSRPQKRKVYRSPERDPVPLGIGDFTTTEVLRHLARIAFLQAVQNEVPDVLISLADRPLKSAEDPIREVDEITEWAVNFNLVAGRQPAAWVTRIARKTVASWLKYPSRAKREVLEWSGLSLDRAEFSPLSPHPEMHVQLPELNFSPLMDRWEQLERSVFDSLERERIRIRDLAVSRGLRPTSQIRNFEHFEWAALYQCGQQEIEEIVDSILPIRNPTDADTADESTIRKSVDKILRIIELTKRPRRK